MKIQRPKLNYEMEWTELQWSGENVKNKVALKIEEVLKRSKEENPNVISVDQPAGYRIL